MPEMTFDDPFSATRVNGPIDFLPAWDVPVLGQSVTASLAADIARVRLHPLPDPSRKMHLILGQPGYGKTHLFARLQRTFGEQIQFVFVAAPTQIQRITDYAAWEVVETLFRSAGTFAPIRTQLARLLAPSFTAYFDQLPSGWKSKAAQIRLALQEDPLSVLEIFGPVTDLVAYHHLADSMRSRFPQLQGSVVRALVLSVSPVAEEARWWLRGEFEQIPEERLRILRLPAEAPSAGDVVEGVAEFLRLTQTPLVLVFDQLDLLLTDPAYGFKELSGQLMGWLQKIPNLVIALGCLDTTWQQQGTSITGAFADRIRLHRLETLKPGEAIDLIQRRMKSWSEYEPSRGLCWPFDSDSIKTFVGSQPTPPRGFIERCGERFNEWLVNKRQGFIRLEANPTQPPDSREPFRREWDKELEQTQRDLKPASDYPDTEIWAMVEEGLQIAKLGGYRADGLVFQGLEVSKKLNFSAVVKFTVAGQQTSVVVVVNKKDSGVAFAGWVNKLEGLLEKPVIGGVAIWPREKLAVGPKSESYLKYHRRVSDGSIRPFPLDIEETTFVQLECLRRMIRRAVTKDLILADKLITVEECRKMVADLGILAKLKLFEFLFENWSAATPTPVLPSEKPIAEPLSQPTIPLATKNETPSEPEKLVQEEPTWSETILKRAVEHLRKKGQPVQALGVMIGPTFVRLKLELRGDADFGKVKRQAENLKVHLAVQHEPLIASQAGYVSIDVQRPDRETVLLPALLKTCPKELENEPAFPAGKDVAGRVEWLNLDESESCHLLVAGTTGSGKSEFLKAMLAGLAARLGPDRIRFRLVDPKRVTFNIDPKSPYLGGPVLYDGSEAIPVLEECVAEMERRYTLLQKRGLDHVRLLKGTDAVPRWVVVFDEFSDLMAEKATKKALEPLLKRLGAKARAAGIHLVLGTQRPEATVVTPLLRSNLPGRIGLQVATERESKLFLDQPDAAYLFGKGDLVWKRGGGLIRLQSPFVPKAEFDRYLMGQ